MHIRKKLAKILDRELKALGLECEPCDPNRLYPAQGYWRSSPYVDCCPWDGYVTRKGATWSYVLHGQTTMTQIVNSGGASLSMWGYYDIDVYDVTGN